MRRSGSFPAILVIAGATALASAVTPAAPAVAAPHRLSAVPSSPIYGLGTDQFGELGNGTTTSALSLWPARASGPPGTVVQLSAGFHSSGALMADGTVWTWGDGRFGQLGYDTGRTSVSTPRRVPGLSGITQLALGGESNGYAVGPGGTVWAWGDNSFGELGNGTDTSSLTPVLVPGLSGITQVSAGPYYVLARGSDGSVWGWGNNAGGYLGDGTTIDRWLPERVQDLNRITQVVAAGANFAVRSDGTLFSWGTNTFGELGNGTDSGHPSLSPAPVPGLPGITQVASSGVSVLAVDNVAERLWAWGYNGCGSFGDGTKNSSDTPGLTGMNGVSQVMQGGEGILDTASAAIRWDGRLWTWGCNGTGWLGTGSTADTATPTLVKNLTNVTQFAFSNAGGLHGDSDNLGFSLAVGTLAATVPNLIGDTQAQAGAVLAAVGLGLGAVTYVADYTCTTIGRVRSQDPSAGAAYPPDLTVSVTVGKVPPSQCP